MSFLSNASLAIAAAVVSVGLSSTALAEDIGDRSGLYLSGTAGYTMPDDSRIDDGFSGTAALGYNISAFRVEVEGGYRENEYEVFSFVRRGPDPAEVTETEDLETISAMVNAFYDFQLNDKWSIYVGGGVGAAFTTLDLHIVAPQSDGTFSSIDDDDTVFAYQGMAGVGYAVNEYLTITAGYRIFHTDDYDFDGFGVDSPWLHTVEIGLRWDL